MRRTDEKKEGRRGKNGWKEKDRWKEMSDSTLFGGSSNPRRADVRVSGRRESRRSSDKTIIKQLETISVGVSPAWK